MAFPVSEELPIPNSGPVSLGSFLTAREEKLKHNQHVYNPAFLPIINS